MPNSSALVGKSAAVPSLVDPEQALQASRALLAHIKKATKENAEKSTKKNLLQEDEESAAGDVPIWLTITSKRHLSQNNNLQPSKIVVPHPLNTNPEVTICLITADPQRAYKDIVASDDFPAELRKRITRVIDFSHLKAKFKQYEAQRKLFSEHDVFLGDDRIINRLPKALGKTFYKSTVKRPIPVVLQKAKPKVDGKRVKREKGKTEEVNARPAAEIAAEIQKAIGAALVSLSPSTNHAIKVGYADWAPENVAANVETVARIFVDKHVPQKWNNIKAIFLKGPQTTALPVWQTTELWTEEKDVLKDDSEEWKSIQAKKDEKAREKANIGKKRKSLDQVEEEAPKEARPAKKAKKVPESNDDKLDQKIAERKASLRKQKKSAKAVLED